MADAVQTAEPAETTDPRSALAEWSGVITKVVFALLIAGAVVLVVLVVNHRAEEDRNQKDRQAWDAVHETLKDAKNQKEFIAGLESAWEQVRESSALPYVMVELASIHFEMAKQEERAPQERKASLEKAKKIYQTALERQAKHPLYGAIAADGVAACNEQEKNYDEAIKVLTGAVGQFEKHYLYTNFCYRLARAYWLRAHAKGQELNSEDRQTVLRYLNMALIVDEKGENYKYEWAKDAELLRTLLSKPGPAWQGPPPPVRPKVEKKTEDKTDMPAEKK